MSAMQTCVVGATNEDSHARVGRGKRVTQGGEEGELVCGAVEEEGELVCGAVGGR